MHRDIDDEVIGRHWWVHDQYAERHPGRSWRFEVKRVDTAQLYCPYPDPGVSHKSPAGLMGSVGLPAVGYAGVAITELARLIQLGLDAGTADLTNVALCNVLGLRDLGVEGIAKIEQPLAFIDVQGYWCVREGIHRSIALSLLGAGDIEGILFESGRLLDTAR